MSAREAILKARMGAKVDSSRETCGKSLCSINGKVSFATKFCVSYSR